MTETSAGAIVMMATEPGWIQVPAALSAAERDAWVAEAVDGLRDGWGEAWDATAELRARSMLEHSLDDRPDAHVVLEAWPIFRPVRVRVQVSMFDSDTLPEWADEGFSVISYDDAPIGPGIMCVRQHEMPAGDGATAALIDWAAVFEAHGQAVMVQVETTLLNLFVAVLPGLHGLIENLHVALPDGSEFFAEPSRHVVTDDDAIWSSLLADADGPDGAGRGESNSRG